VKSSEGVEIICEDDGVCVPGNVKQKIFNRGYFQHTGFGLYLSREIVSITGFSIEETGEPGTGARFEIHIPEGAFRFSSEDTGSTPRKNE
jgi:sensor histidine kinase regulating citrate/malate metabolism